MDKQIDVLAVMDDLRRGCRAFADSEGRDRRTNYANDLLERRYDEARAAVAELVAASRDAAAVLQDKAGPLEQETPRRLFAALARIGNAP